MRSVVDQGLRPMGVVVHNRVGLLCTHPGRAQFLLYPQTRRTAKHRPRSGASYDLRPATALRIAAMNTGLVPQHPPTMLAPDRISSRVFSPYSSGFIL